MSRVFAVESVVLLDSLVLLFHCLVTVLSSACVLDGSGMVPAAR